MAKSTRARYGFEGLERTLHEKARLGLLAALAAAGGDLTFGVLKEQCGLTDGNLNRHLDVLKSAGVIELWKGFAANRPQTIVRLTAAGRRRLRTYLRLLERIVTSARADAAKPARRRRLPSGFART